MKWRIQDGEVILFGWIYRLFWPKTLATSCEELTHWKRLWCWQGLGAGGEEDNRGWDGWMASPTRWTWVWVNSGSWGQGGLACCDSWGRKESNTTERLNWTELRKASLLRHAWLNHWPLAVDSTSSPSPWRSGMGQKFPTLQSHGWFP